MRRNFWVALTLILRKRVYNILSKVYTVKDIMVMLSISKNTAYSLVKQDGFPVIKIKNCYRIPKEAFDRWMDGFSQQVTT